MKQIHGVVAASLLVFFLALPGISSAQTMTTAQLQVEIKSLLAMVQSLQQKLAVAQGGPSATWCYVFSTNLEVGNTGPEVQALQQALSKDGETITISGTFDEQTASAVTGFQQKYASQVLTPSGLKNGTGFVGKATRAKLNSLFGCGTTMPTPTPNPVSTPTCPTSSCTVIPTSTTSVGASAKNLSFAGVADSYYFALITLTNSGNATATWVSSGPAWISFGPEGQPTLTQGQLTAGNIPAGLSDTFLVIAYGPSLGVGSATSGVITFSGNFPQISIQVSFANNASGTATTAPVITSISPSSEGGTQLLTNTITLYGSGFITAGPGVGANANQITFSNGSTSSSVNYTAVSSGDLGFWPPSNLAAGT